MTYTPKPDEQQVLKQSAHFSGFTGSFYQTLPDEVRANASGGGAVSVTDALTEISAGSTSGDTASILGPGARQDTYARLPFWVEIIYSRKRGDPLPLTDDVVLGFTYDLDLASNRHAVLDLTAQEFAVNGDTVAQTPIPQNDESLAYFSVTVDRQNGNTRFRHVIPNENVDDTAVYGRANVFSNGLRCGAKSNGNDEGVNLYNIKYSFRDDRFAPGDYNVTQ